MKNIKTLFSLAIIATSILFSSCGNKMYSYRSKVNIDKSTAVSKVVKTAPFVKTKETKINTENNTITLPLNVEPNANVIAKALNKETLTVKNSTQNEAKVAVKNPIKQIKATKKQLKALNKITKSASGLGIDAKSWIIWGLILILGGIIIAFIIPTLGYVIGSVGFIMVLIGLISFLLDMV